MNTVLGEKLMYTRTRQSGLIALLAAMGCAQPALAGGPYVINSVSPCRIVDTREADPAFSAFSGDRIGAGETVPFFVTEDWIAGQGGATDCGIPDNATGVFINVVAVSPVVAKVGASGGYLTLYPYGEDKPTASTINYNWETTAIANGVMMPICDPAGAVCDYDLNVYNHVNLDVHLVIDVAGYLTE